MRTSVSVGVTIERRTPEAFGVPCSGVVAFCFADDAKRFRAMEYVNCRQET